MNEEMNEEMNEKMDDIIFVFRITIYNNHVV